MVGEKVFHCRVCGYPSPDAPWGPDGETPTFDFCRCCGVEYGYQDSSPFAARRYRSEWLKSGAKWEDPKAKPENWDLDAQLRNIPEEFR